MTTTTKKRTRRDEIFLLFNTPSGELIKDEGLLDFVSKKFGISKPNASKHLSDLEADGLIFRERVNGSRAQNKGSLTPNGEKELERLGVSRAVRIDLNPEDAELEIDQVEERLEALRRLHRRESEEAQAAQRRVEQLEKELSDANQRISEQEALLGAANSQLAAAREALEVS